MKYQVMGFILLAACSSAPEPDSRIGESAPPLESAAPVTNMEWRLIELNGRPAVATPGATPVTLKLVSAERRVQGNGGCNEYSGSYTMDGQSLRFGEIISTKRACVDEALNQQEVAFFEVLSRVDRYTTTGNTLTLYRGDRALAKFTRT